MKTRDQIERELRIFADQADQWALAAVYLYMDKGVEADPNEIEALCEEMELAAE